MSAQLSPRGTVPSGTSEEQADVRYVVGVDGSASAKDALVWALRTAARTGARVVAVAVYQYPVAGYPTYSGYVPAMDTADMESETRHLLEQTVKDVVAATPGVEDVAVTELVAEGHPAVVLVDASRGADLVVVGCRGHGGFVGALVGSVSQHVVAHAHCPVVVVRHPRQPREG